VDLMSCVNYCHRNIDPSSEKPLACSGFNFRPGRSPECEMFSFTNETNNATILPTEHPIIYFKKTCLRVPQRCAESAFVFDVRRGYTLRATSESRDEDEEEKCAEVCLADQCRAFVWDPTHRKCHYFKSPYRELIESDSNLTYYENNCVTPSARCSVGERVEFILIRRADESSFGTAVEEQSLRNCMEKCVNTTMFYCRSLQFDHTTNECFLSYEESESAISSHNIDVYEPFCSEADSICTRPYTFTKMVSSKLISVVELQLLKNFSVEACLSTCIRWRKKCRSANYDNRLRHCFLMPHSKQDLGASIVESKTFDYFEPACLPEIHDVKTHTDSPPHEIFQLLETNRTLRQEYRSIQHLQTISLEKCWLLCRNATSFLCHTFSYSKEKHECIVSSSIVNNRENYEKITQRSHLFDLYVYCRYERTGVLLHRSRVYPFRQRIRLRTICKRSDKPYPNSYNHRLYHQGICSFAPCIDCHEGGWEPARIFECSMEFQSLLPRDRRFLSDFYIERNNISGFGPELHQFDLETTAHLASTSKQLGFVPSEAINVQAECHTTGINVSFLLNHKYENYTGVIYAAERFEQCRLFVRSSSEFSIFIPRPRYNTWCNAVEIDKIASIVIVMSNDRILPYDVTTKDDLFFHVTCNYTVPSISGTWQGSVFGGASPVKISSHDSRDHISLQILKKGIPVNSVFIGEILVVRVESDISPDRLHITACTAHRVGGTGPPTSVSLIVDGCALLPSLMTPMELGTRGWESSLSAFRIDGSEQIDVVCMLDVCPDKTCPELSCPPSKERPIRSLFERPAIRVCHRLIVRTGHSDGFQDDRAFPELCLQPTVYLFGLFIMMLSLTVLTISACVGARRRRDSAEDLSVSRFPVLKSDMGAKYIKTLSL
ncbi:hypothetical protein Angca_001949, partial [Angiostrongylus cantonensis]